jgi:SAM-dependent methyltransferase
MEFTGERYVPHLDSPSISLEHWHRYLWAAQFAAGRVVLDVACGEGYGSDLLARTAARVVGIDRDPRAIDHARASYSRPNLACGEARAIPADDDDLFDLIVSFETIEHLTGDEQKEFIGELQRLLKPDGAALISTPDKHVYSDRENYHNSFHLGEFYRGDFEEFLTSAFRHVEIFGQKIYPVSYLWPLDGRRRSLCEFELDFVGDHFAPGIADRKEARYLVAVCTNVERALSDASVLIDVAERIFRPLGTGPAKVIPGPIPIRYSIDTVDGVVVAHSQSRPVAISARASFEVRGWAMDAGADAPVARVAIAIDRTKEIVADYGRVRPDLARAFGQSHANGGFAATIPAGSLAPGTHALSIKCIGNDGKTEYLLPRLVEVEIARRPVGRSGVRTPLRRTRRPT